MEFTTDDVIRVVNRLKENNLFVPSWLLQMSEQDAGNWSTIKTEFRLNQPCRPKVVDYSFHPPESLPGNKQRIDEYHQRLERISTGILAGFSANPNPGENTANARGAIDGAKALIHLLDQEKAKGQQ